MSRVLLLVLTAIFYGSYNFFVKVSSAHINQILGAAILQLVATLMGGAALLYLKLINSSLEISSKGVLFAILAGISVGLAEIMTFYLFSKGIAASVGIPIIIGGGVLVGALLGIAFLKKSLSFIQYLAITMIIAGIVILFVKQ